MAATVCVPSEQVRTPGYTAAARRQPPRGVRPGLPRTERLCPRDENRKRDTAELPASHEHRGITSLVASAQAGSRRPARKFTGRAGSERVSQGSALLRRGQRPASEDGAGTTAGPGHWCCLLVKKHLVFSSKGNREPEASHITPRRPRHPWIWVSPQVTGEQQEPRKRPALVCPDTTCGR